VGVNVGAPIAIDGADGAFTGSQDAKLNLTTPAGSTTTVKTLGGSIIDSPVILAGGDVVVGDQARVLHRFRPDGTQVWAAEPVLDGPVLAALVLAGGSAALLVPTAAGTLHAVAADGTVLWGGALTQGQALRAGNVHTPPGAAFGTAYFGSSDGKLYAVAVEGRLDAAAPWPKAHHDARNTSNAASPLP
jgi:outer membrane protein assembly factor BamB